MLILILTIIHTTTNLALTFVQTGFIQIYILQDNDVVVAKVYVRVWYGLGFE
jgi:hypothetical protein